jgi:hypothetical protein
MVFTSNDRWVLQDSCIDRASPLNHFSTHSSHLLQMFNVAVAIPFKVAFNQEFDRGIQLLVVADQVKRNRSQILRRILVKNFINTVHVEILMQILNQSFRRCESYFTICPNRSNCNTPWIYPIPKLSRLFGSEQRWMKRSWPLAKV